MVEVLLAVVGPVVGEPHNWTDHGQQHCYHHVPMANQRQASAAGDRLLMMGTGMPETRSAVFKRQAVNL